VDSESYLDIRIKELEADVRKLNARLKEFNSLEPGRWVAWQSGYDAAHEDIQMIDPQQNPYRKERASED
jgi:hypothetical protein